MLIVIYNLLITVHLRCNVVMVPESAVQMDKRVRHIVTIIHKHRCIGVVEVGALRVQRVHEPPLDRLKLIRQTLRPLPVVVNPLAQLLNFFHRVGCNLAIVNGTAPFSIFGQHRT